MISPAWLKAGELFPESTVFMIAIQDQFISTNNYKNYFFWWRCDRTRAMVSSFNRLLDHTQRRTRFAMTPPNE